MWKVQFPNADRQELTVSNLIEKYKYIKKQVFSRKKRMTVNSYSNSQW